MNRTIQAQIPLIRHGRYPRSIEVDIRTLLWLGLGLVGLWIVSVGWTLSRYYSEYSELIDVQGKLRQPEVQALYSQPFRLRVGQPLSVEELSRWVARLGYTSALEGQVLEIEGPAESCAVEFSGGKDPHIRRLRRQGNAVEELQFRPAFLSNSYDRSRTKKKYVQYEELPPFLIHAVLAAEDQRFFEHHGIDYWAALRALYVNVRRRGTAQGASTLTQQFVKNYFLTPERTLARKLEEAVLAVLLELRFSKEELFELYANEVYLGHHGSFAIKGFGAAADVYFGKNVSRLTVAEAALLAGMIQLPNRYSPYDDPHDSIARRNHVLGLMVRRGLLSAEQKQAAENEELRIVPRSAQNYFLAPYFVDYVNAVLARSRLAGYTQAGIRVQTTLDPQLQQAAFEAVIQGMENVEKELADRNGIPDPQVSLVVLDPRSGELLAMIGGRNYYDSQLNRSVNSRRQPGSAFKPFVYATALETRLKNQQPFTLSSLLVDEPSEFTFGDELYAPQNYGGQYRGRVTLRQALALSLNVPTVRLAETIGYRSVASLARQMGFGEQMGAFPSIALGTVEVSLLELAQAYSAFANEGRFSPVRAIRGLEVNGRALELPAHEQIQVLSPQVAFLVTSAMESVLNHGTGHRARARGFRLPAAGKTGSSNDSWFVGFTPDLLCAVWVGIDEKVPLNLTGSQAALPIWTEFMLRAQRLGYLSGKPFSRPENIIAVEIDPDTGLRASFLCEHRRFEYYVKGTEPHQYCLGADEHPNYLSPGIQTLSLNRAAQEPPPPAF